MRSPAAGACPPAAVGNGLAETPGVDDRADPATVRKSGSVRKGVSVSVRTALVVLGLVAAVTWRTPSRADSSPDFLTLARAAIGSDEALAHVHGLHVVFTVRRGTVRTPTQQIWLAPPTRFLERANRFSYGFDGRRIIGVNPPWLPANGPPDRYAFLHWSLALLLYDPPALGVSIIDRGTEKLGRHSVHVLQATAGDSDFYLRLYFDPDSHRLVRTDGTRISVAADQLFATEIPEQDIYGGYRRVDGVELPFNIVRNIVDGQGTTMILDVVNYEVNPKNLDVVFGS